MSEVANDQCHLECESCDLLRTRLHAADELTATLDARAKAEAINSDQSLALEKKVEGQQFDPALLVTAQEGSVLVSNFTPLQSFFSKHII
jgi:hypothetical protein